MGAWNGKEVWSEWVHVSEKYAHIAARRLQGWELVNTGAAGEMCLLQWVSR